jgi:hypothetical protein
MLAELVKFAEKATLIMRSGIQCLDFGLKLDPRRQPPGEFAMQPSLRSLARLEYDERGDRLVHPAQPGVAVKSKLSVPVEDSLRLLDGCWLPMPYLRAGRDSRFADGPTTWARGRIVALEPGEDLHGSSHRFTLAFDTNVLDDAEDTVYLAPTRADVDTGAAFRLAWRATEMGWFIEVPWVSAWLREAFEDGAPARLRLPPEDIDEELGRFSQHAHYLNWLATVGSLGRLPEVVVRSNAPDDPGGAIPVDMVLDVGNSRTCGILIEDHPQQGHGLKNRYELALRDLTLPHRVYVEPFESRVEFAQVVLGKEHLACQSGRSDAFVWPTIARVGPEARRLANRRRGTEGSTGLSSPKRYLWDEDRYRPGWRFNVAASRAEIEPHATGAPFSNLINELGDALYDLADEDKMPVFMPHYARSALMTFMLAEVLTQALVQINSPAQRLKQGDPEKPRHLRSVILTVPPSMPKPEREIFARRTLQAMALVWKALGWHDEDAGVDGADRETAWPPFPEIHARWDEATCAQVVWVFSETQEHFGGRPEDFFPAIRRQRRDDTDKRITVASIDIGGGTTDLVITDYRLDEGAGANVYIMPDQRFRDGFKVAGDDLLLEVVQKVVVPAIAEALRGHGLNDPDPLLSRLIGAESVSVQDSALRQQLSLQILYPLGLRILADYERFQPVAPAAPQTVPLGGLLEGREPPSEAVLAYFATGVRRELGTSSADFDLLAVPVALDLARLHDLFLDDRLEICKSIQALCEIVHLYDCDVLLLSGRPSKLPGIQALFRALLPVPPDRIVPLHGYRCGTWYPFHKDGRIDDPKTTAAVGAMLCKVGGERRIPNFNFLANAFKPYSTVRFIGMMDQNMIIKDEDVHYRDVRLDDPEYTLPDEPFEVRARMVIGFRQLDTARWSGSPLYVLDLSDRAKVRLAQADGRGDPAVLQVTLQQDRTRRSERFEIATVTTTAGVSVGRSDLSLTLNTLNAVGIGETSYWLDTGSVLR